MLSRINEAILRLVARFRGEEGQALSEYGLILALIAVGAVVALTAVGAAVTGVLDDIATELTNAVGG